MNSVHTLAMERLIAMKKVLVGAMAALLTGLIVNGTHTLSAQPISDPFHKPIVGRGGLEVWIDTRFHAGRRLQKNTITGHGRIIDNNEQVLCWGAFDTIERSFQNSMDTQKDAVSSDHLVVLVHGLAATPRTFEAMKTALLAAGYSAVAVSYPSTRGTLEQHAFRLEQLLDQTRGATTVSFVTHSMGGLVVRHLLARQGSWRQRLELGRIVQIAPPNRGSMLARWIMDVPLYDATLGPAAKEIAVAKHKTPALPLGRFAIVAGGQRDGGGYNPFLPGDDDGLLRVDETRLAGARDFLVIPAFHTEVAGTPEAIKATLAFLQDGTFDVQPAESEPAPNR